MKTPLAALALLLSSAALATDIPVDSPAESATEDAQVQAVIDAVEARYAKVDTIRSDFTQVKRDPTFGDMSQDGFVVVARPARMRWEFTTGDEQVFATDGQTMTIYTKADNFYQQMPDSTAGNASVQGFLTSLDQLDEVFHVKLVEGAIGEGAGPVLDLTPKKPGAISAIRLDLDADLVVEQVIMTDSYGNVTDLSFRGMVFDQPVKDSLFKFEKPASTLR